MIDQATLDPIVTATFELSPLIEGVGVLTLLIERPKPDADGDWSCRQQIVGIAGESTVQAASGVDSLQALVLCLAMARARLQSIEQRFHSRLTYHGRDFGALYDFMR